MSPILFHTCWTFSWLRSGLSSSQHALSCIVLNLTVGFSLADKLTGLILACFIWHEVLLTCWLCHWLTRRPGHLTCFIKQCYSRLLGFSLADKQTGLILVCFTWHSVLLAHWSLHWLTSRLDSSLHALSVIVFSPVGLFIG